MNLLKNIPDAQNFNFNYSINETNFGGELGILKGWRFTNDEITECKNLIFNQLVQNLKKQKVLLDKNLNSKRIHCYHNFVDDEVHKICLSKKARILNKEAANKIFKMSFFKNLEQFFPNYKISDEEKVGHSNFCFRFVRPYKEQDIGSLHTDTWFWEYYKMSLPKDHGRFKVWMSLCGDPENSGLLFFPYSHNKKIGYKVIKDGHKVKFVTDQKISENYLKRYSEPHGTPVLFNHHVLHVGSINKSNLTRVSIEFTVLFKLN